MRFRGLLAGLVAGLALLPLLAVRVGVASGPCPGLAVPLTPYSSSMARAVYALWGRTRSP